MLLSCRVFTWAQPKPTITQPQPADFSWLHEDVPFGADDKLIIAGALVGVGILTTGRLKLLQAPCKGMITDATLAAAHTMLAEAEECRQDILALIAQAEQRRVQAEQERANSPGRWAPSSSGNC